MGNCGTCAQTQWRLSACFLRQTALGLLPLCQAGRSCALIKETTPDSSRSNLSAACEPSDPIFSGPSTDGFGQPVKAHGLALLTSILAGVFDIWPKTAPSSAVAAHTSGPGGPAGSAEHRRSQQGCSPLACCCAHREHKTPQNQGRGLFNAEASFFGRHPPMQISKPKYQPRSWNHVHQIGQRMGSHESAGLLPNSAIKVGRGLSRVPKCCFSVGSAFFIWLFSQDFSHILRDGSVILLPAAMLAPQ